MNDVAHRTCVAARHWRALADFYINDKQTDSRLTGMPVEKSFLHVKELCSLYLLVERKLEHRAPKCSRQDDKKLTEQMGYYKNDFFPDNFGDGGYLDAMKTFEDDSGESMADIVDTKYGTNLPLNWTSKDTKAATELATKLRGDYRDEKEDPSAEKVDLREWHAYMTYEVRSRILAERAEQNKKVAKPKPNGEY